MKPGLTPFAALTSYARSVLGPAARNWMPVLVVVGLGGALYLRTMQPTLGGMFNSEEFQQAAYSLSLAHSTGYPLYLMLGKVWVTLVVVGDVAYRLNLFSAFWALDAAVLTYCITLSLARSQFAAVLAGFVFVTNEAVWRYASVAEVDTFTTFLAGAVILSLLRWRQQHPRLEVVGLVYGFALAHHRTSALYAPALVLFVLMHDRSVLRSPALVVRTALAALVPLAAYLYVPLRAATSPEIERPSPVRRWPSICLSICPSELLQCRKMAASPLSPIGLSSSLLLHPCPLGLY
jgi:Protein O-mannosyl-transferase TMEM260-like